MNNRRVKFGLKIPNGLGKMSEDIGVDFWLTPYSLNIGLRLYKRRNRPLGLHLKQRDYVQ